MVLSVIIIGISFNGHLNNCVFTFYHLCKNFRQLGQAHGKNFSSKELKKWHDVQFGTRIAIHTLEMSILSPPPPHGNDKGFTSFGCLRSDKSNLAWLHSFLIVKPRDSFYNIYAAMLNFFVSYFTICYLFFCSSPSLTKNYTLAMNHFPDLLINIFLLRQGSKFTPLGLKMRHR